MTISNQSECFISAWQRYLFMTLTPAEAALTKNTISQNSKKYFTKNNNSWAVLVAQLAYPIEFNTRGPRFKSSHSGIFK